MLALALCCALAAPVGALAADGKKHFKEGLKYEENRQWDKAAEKFVLAVAEKPSNIEYQLHLQRALVSAAIMLIERGDLLAEKKDYNAAHQAYRQAYAYDRGNELALVKMRRMLEALGLPTDGLPQNGRTGAKPGSDPNVKTGYAPDNPQAKKVQIPATGKFQKTNVISRSDNLMSVIESLGQTMGLNVVFDTQAGNQIRSLKLQIELRDVTYPRALETILKINNLSYAQIDTRTIVIFQDNPASRQRYEPYAVRTFYVKNADVQEVRTAIQTALQAKSIVHLKQLNALIVRDTPANLELIGEMIHSLDKSKAEVLIDINIYEVSRNDMMQIGNQFNVPGDGNQSGALDLSGLGGLGQEGLVAKAGRAHSFVTGTHLGFALGLPTSLISFFQDKGKAKLLASTQVHVIDNEQHSIRIGQRVPIQTAFIPTFTNTTVVNPRPNQNNPNVTPGQNPNDFTAGVNPFSGGSGFPQFQYENVGLNIDMTPNVFEDEVQLKMKIESSSLDRSTGNFTPSFNQRTMSSVARIKDGQAAMVAGVSQTEQAKQIKGIPIIGLIPILGQFFATPRIVDRQSDVVITVTPHILRRADITEEDHLAKAAGYANDPSPKLSIETILYLADLEDAEKNQSASASEKSGPGKAAAAAPPTATQTSLQAVGPVREGVVVTPPPAQQQRPVVQPRVENTIVEKVGEEKKPPARPPDPEDDEEEEEEEENPNQAPVMVSVRSASAVATKGQDFYVAVIVNGNSELFSANVSLSYDSNVLDVKAVRDGGLLRNPSLQFHAEGGLLSIQMERPQGAGGVPARGQLALIVFTVKGQGQSPLTLNDGQTFLRTSTGQLIPLKLQSSQVEAR
jgi:general secretion pathway protein D